MAIKTINDSPTISDQIVFPIDTPDADGCFLSNPYKVDGVAIYYVQRNYTSGSPKSVDFTTVDQELLDTRAEAKATACDDPSAENLAALDSIDTEIMLRSKQETVYFTDASVVAQFGTPDFPAWLSTDADNAILTLVDEDADGNPQYGHFTLEWTPLGMREGDYFICWTWTPLPSGEKLSASTRFSLGGDPQITTSIPTHFTRAGKYETLFERYTPEMFKVMLSDNDLTPPVLQEMHKAFAKAFTFMEDLANQTVDLADANATHEAFLPLLGNTLGLKLRSADPTLWRRQIKRAVPLYKRKGTLGGLAEALAQAGVILRRFTKLWQVVSSYTFQEVFVVADGDASFALSRAMVLPIDYDNFALYYRAVDSDDWQTLGPDYVSFSGSTMTWAGDDLSISPISLSDGDEVRVLYEVTDVPGSPEQSVEDYVRTLPLMDQRDERLQTYPPKNWNVRLIEEDDPLFDVVVPNRHPFYDPVVYGWVRTEFPYSENVYNMESYNGSTRQSTAPCDIDRDFLDACSGGLSSKYTVDLEIENISNDRILEAQEVLREFTPFHAVLHSINLYGGVNEFVASPVEELRSLVHMSGSETAVVDPPQMIFNRTMTSAAQFKRDALASMTQVATGASGTAKNSAIVLFSPDFALDRVPLDDTPSLTYLEVLSPSANAGTYTVESPDGHRAELAGATPSEPLDETAFTFRLSNEVARKVSATITQANTFTLFDPTQDFAAVRSGWDADNDPDYTGGAWKVSIPAYGGTYAVLDVTSSSGLLLEDDGSLPNASTTGVTYTLKNDSSVAQATGGGGVLRVVARGLVDVGTGTILIRGQSVAASSIEQISHIVERGYYLLYAGTQYPVSDFPADDNLSFYVSGYTGGDVSGVQVVAYQRAVDAAVGYFGYKGIVLETSTDYEASLGISNGANAPPDDQVVEDDHFMENFLVVIGTDYYAITGIDGTTVTLSGPSQSWKLSGTAVTFSINRYIKQASSVPERNDPHTQGHDFDFIDRRGNEVFEIGQEDYVSGMAVAQALNAAKRGGDAADFVELRESITFSITHKKEND